MYFMYYFICIVWSLIETVASAHVFLDGISPLTVYEWGTKLWPWQTS